MEPTTAQAGERAALGDAIERFQSEIERRWLERMRAEVATTRIEPTDLKDGIGLYLGRIVQGLRGASTLETAGREAWTDVAQEHALTRVRLGFDVAQLTHELALLRRTVVHTLREEGFLPATNSATEDLSELFDAAIAASVDHYVRARNYEDRRREAEHVGFLAHQMRSPLSAVALSLDRAARSVSRINELLEKTLVVQRMQSGQVEARPVETTLGDAIDDVVAANRSAAAAKGLAFRADYDPAERVRVDPGLLCTALEHLLENSVKYTDRGQVALSAEFREGTLHLHVRDSCEGLSEEELQIIFEPFRRGRTDQTGTGLGLAIVRRAVEALGGEVHAESPAAEGGCHFWFTVPGAVPTTRH